MVSLEEGVYSLYEVTYVEEKPQSNTRLDKLAACIQSEFEDRGIAGWATRERVEAYTRDKKWDLVHPAHGRPKVAISLTSLLRNLTGTVPNRTDGLIGEVADLQMRYPEVVTASVMVVDVAATQEEPNRQKWANELNSRLKSISGRSPPSWGRGLMEESLVIETEMANAERATEVNINISERRITEFFDTLVAQYEDRFPSGGQQTL